MNISTKNDLTTQKVLAICSIKTDFIFLSDMRLNSTKQVAAINDLEKKFFFNGYKLLYNSRDSSRGVGILIEKKIQEKIQVLGRADSVDGNFLALHLRFKNVEFVLCSIYGPNRDRDAAFFDELRNTLQAFNCPLIVGGDWNATFDISPANINLDVVNMQNIPSQYRTRKVLEICETLNLVEPFRTLHPNQKDYTFIPTSVNETNRSRLDFFLISKNIFGTGTVVNIPHSLSTTLFDHKYVKLFMNRPKPARKNIVKDCILKNVDLPSHVKASVFECYLHHYTNDGNVPNLPTGAEIQAYLATIGRIMTLLKDIGNLELKQAVEGYTEREELIIQGKRGEIGLLFDDMPELNFFENLPNVHAPDIFFQTLASCVKKILNKTRLKF